MTKQANEKRRLALLTLEDRGSYVFDDDLLIEPLEAKGWDVESVPWRRPWDGDRFHCVVVRTTWDYHKHPEAFLAALQRIEDSGALLLNPLSLIRWNLQKTYLRDLEALSLPVVPTHWLFSPTTEQIRQQLRLHSRAVIKPVISASADDTFLLDGEPAETELHAIARTFHGRECMMQPFMPGIESEGEFSLFYFDGELSHSVLKTPKSRDFRVQEEHGGSIRVIERPELKLLQLSERLLAGLRPAPLYARLDWVRHGQGFAVMEVELIEPSLYLRHVPAAAERFANALERRYGRSAER